MGSERPESERMSGPPPLKTDTPEPDIDRVKLLRAWELNVETQRAVLRRSAIVGWLTLLATLVQIAVAGYVLHRIDKAEGGFATSQAEMTGMLRDALTAQSEVHKVEIAEKVEEVQIDEMLAAAEEPVAEDKPPAGTARLELGAAKKIFAKAKRARKAAASAPKPPPAPVAAMKKKSLEKRRAAQRQIEDVLGRLSAAKAPESGRPGSKTEAAP